MSLAQSAGPLLVGACLLAQAASAFANPLSGGCATCAAPTASCGPTKIECPPFYKHYFEGPPKIKFKRGCPRPICDPCHLPHYGYFATCWGPWPFQEDWSHCPYPVAAQMLPPPAVPPYAPRVPARLSDRAPTTPGTEAPKAPSAPMPPVIPEIPPPRPLDSDKEKGKEEKDKEETGLEAPKPDPNRPKVRLIGAK